MKYVNDCNDKTGPKDSRP